uniref:hypothetical protein n=1 Tax=Alistipes sp. D31t1_170403_E11 TaxID=2787128 RepID=UPI00189A26CA|nr:hypothetical protein [Alistipes sp. D31t1_170403_E11]
MKSENIPAFAGIPAHKIAQYEREFERVYPAMSSLRPRRRRIVRHERVIPAQQTQ